MQNNTSGPIDVQNHMRAMLHDSKSGVVLLEYIQNAADCGATYVHFTLTNDALFIEHDGTPFTSSNIDAFLTIAGTTKYFEHGQIGGFGRGARSALFFCRELTLISGPYKLIIDPENYPQPTELSKDEPGKRLTTFILKHRNHTPLNVSDNFGVRTDETYWAFTLARAQYDIRLCLAILAMNSRSLFHISITIASQTTIIAASAELSSSRILLSVNSPTISDELHAYTFRRRTTELGPISVGVFDNNDDDVGLFCCGLPIAVPTRTSFSIDALFRPNQARDTIPIDEGHPHGEHNRLLIKEAAALVADWIVEERDKWVLTAKFRLALPISSTRGRDRDIVAEFMARLRDNLKRLPLIPASTGVYPDIEWFCVTDFGTKVAYELPNRTSWPIPNVTLASSDSVEAIIRLLRGRPTTLTQALRIAAKRLENGEEVVWENGSLRAWQSEIAASIKRIRLRKARTLIVRDTLYNMNILMLSETERTSPRDILIAEPNLSFPTRTVIESENDRDFVALFLFEDLVDVLIRQLQDTSTYSAAISALNDHSTLAQLSRRDAQKLASASIWPSCGKPTTTHRISDMCDPSAIPDILKHVPEIAALLPSNEFLHTTQVVGEAAGTPLRLCPDLAALCRIIRRCQKRRHADAANQLLAVGELLVNNYSLLISEVGALNSSNLATLQSSWIPRDSSLEPKELIPPSSFIFPSETAIELFSTIGSFPPFGSPAAWSTTSSGVALKHDLHLLDIDRLDDVIAIIDSAETLRATKHPEMALRVREYLSTARRQWCNKYTDDHLRRLLVPCTIGLQPLMDAVSPEERYNEWRQRDVLSANYTITIECWAAMSAREKILCMPPHHLDRPWVLGKGYRVLHTTLVPSVDVVGPLPVFGTTPLTAPVSSGWINVNTVSANAAVEAQSTPPATLLPDNAPPPRETLVDALQARLQSLQNECDDNSKKLREYSALIEQLIADRDRLQDIVNDVANQQANITNRHNAEVALLSVDNDRLNSEITKQLDIIRLGAKEFKTLKNHFSTNFHTGHTITSKHPRS
jgi:hypothetical protein